MLNVQMPSLLCAPAATSPLSLPCWAWWCGAWCGHRLTAVQLYTAQVAPHRWTPLLPTSTRPAAVSLPVFPLCSQARLFDKQINWFTRLFSLDVARSDPWRWHGWQSRVLCTCNPVISAAAKHPFLLILIIQNKPKWFYLGSSSIGRPVFFLQFFCPILFTVHKQNSEGFYLSVAQLLYHPALVFAYFCLCF